MKKFLFVQQQAPHSTIVGQEGLDAVLMGSAFVSCSVLLLGDGIFQLLKGQTPETHGLKNYSKSYAALLDYGVENIYCNADHLRARHINEDDLILPVQILDSVSTRQIMLDHDVILSF